MLLKESQLTLGKLLRRKLGSGDHDPAALSASIRELALRAHELVRATDVCKSEPGAGTPIAPPELEHSS